jgi:cysteinyl-tRNA synthetase
MKLKLYNTLTKQIEEIKPVNENVIKMYNCGPTVYWRAHIGNIRAYSGWDVLHRFLLYTGVDVKRLVNFTDVGHMTGDEDFGSDKIENTAREENKTPLDIANYYIGTILSDFKKMNFLNPGGMEIDTNIDIAKMSKKDWEVLGWARATDYIQEMIDIVKKIEANGYTYETDQAVYFDTDKYPEYTSMSGQKLSEKLEGVREDVNVDPLKKNPADFVLWMKAVKHYANHMMKWESPWGVGFPGWHIECTAMGTKILGDEFDIHTGGTDHIPVHHTNERAQNWGAFQKEVVRYWVHNEMLTAKEGDKLSKSKKNAHSFQELLDMGYDGMDIRYYFLTVNYRMQMPFSLEGLDGARNSRQNLVKRIATLVKQNNLQTQLYSNSVEHILEEYRDKFVEALSDNLNTSGALAIVSELLKSGEVAESILESIFDFDNVLGLKLRDFVKQELSKESAVEDAPSEIQELLNMRNEAKKSKDYQTADKLRDEIKAKGFTIVDSAEGSKLVKN